MGKIRCEVSGCDRTFKTKGGYASHLRAHRRDGDLTEAEMKRIRADKAIEAAERKARTYERLYRQVLDQHADVNNLVERMKDVLPTVEPQGPWVPSMPAGDQEEEEAILLFSDSQIGTKSLGEEIGLVEPRVYGPLGRYDFDVFRYRLRVWQRAVGRITALQRASIPVRKLNLWFLGDIIENEVIFRGQGAYIETGVLQQYFASLYEIGQSLAMLAADYEEVEIRGVTGNHGRVRPRPGATKTWVNWEWLWYRYLELLARDIPNVTFDLTMSWFDLPVVQGYRWLILHGEDAKRYLRFPWYGTDRMEKNYGELLETVGSPFTYMAFGHHHVLASFQTTKGEWFCNGNWVGANAYSVKKLYEMALPKQWMFFVHPKRGVTSRWPIDLMVEDEELWAEVEGTSYDIHVPPNNQEILAAMDAARYVKI